MFDHETMYAIGLARNEDIRREAARQRQANAVPRVQAPGVRTRLSRWLLALANRLEPAVEPRIAPAELHAR